MSVLPVVGSELPTDSDAAMVVTENVDGVRGETLDAVDEGVGQSCVRADSAEAWPVLHDERSVMSFLVRPVVVLTSQFFYRMTLVMMIVSHRWRVVVCLCFILWTWTPSICYLEIILRTLRLGLKLRCGTGGVSSVVSHVRLGCRSFRIQTARIGFVESEGHMFLI